MSDLIKRDDALHIVDVAEDEHPYKVPGLFVTYSEYNQGWSDAVDFIRSRMEKADPVPAAPRWVRCEEPPKEKGAFAVACVYDGKWYWCKGLFLDGKWLREGDGAEIPADYWMPIDPPKEGE